MATIRIQFRYDTTDNWNQANPILLKGEMGIEFRDNNTQVFKIGDGVQDPDTGVVTGTHWNDLPYVSGPSGLPPAHEWNQGNLRFQNPNGTWGAYENLQGPTGQTGATGPKGDKPDHQWNGFQIRFQKPDGTWGDYVNIRGQQGLKGEKGDKGDQGVPGPPYILPPATKTLLGGIKVGDNLTITLDGCLSAPYPFRIPIRGIIAYNGSLAGSDGRRPIDPWDGHVYEDFVLCDGIMTNGLYVPDLRGRFIIGTDSTYTLNMSGGSNSHTHRMFIAKKTETNIGVTWDFSNQFTEATTLQAKDAPVHTHKVAAGQGWLQHGFGHVYGNPLAWADPRYSVGTADWSELPISGEVASIGQWPITSQATGRNFKHTHMLKVQDTGVASNVPSFFSLMFIMRVK